MWDISIHPPWESDALVGTLAPHGRVALIPFVTSQDPLRRNTILSALGPSALTVLFPAAQEQLPRPSRTLAPHGRVALIPFVTSQDPLRRNTIFSALGPSALTVLFLAAQEQLPSRSPILGLLTHPGIALASTCLTSEYSSPPKPLSHQKASC
ncbi:hypothetical protein ACLB2K_073244 [Fragaria x ananassa]